MSPPKRRYLALDHWRGLIALFVVLEHAAVSLWSGPYEVSGFERALRWAIVAPLLTNVGTHMFFVISGYCLASSVDPARGKVRSPAGYLGRRFWRIYPTYWAALAFFVLVISALDAAGLDRWHRNGLTLELASPVELGGWQWLGNLTLTETWRPRVAHFGADEAIYTRVAWSLCIQEQFYAVAAVLLAFFPRRFFQALGVASAAFLGYAVFAFDCGATDRIRGTFLIYWHEFTIGLLLYWRLNRADSARVKRAIEIGLAAVFAASLACRAVTMAAASGFGLGLIALYRWDDAIDASRRLAPIRELGRRSYSIYLVHLPVGIVVASALDAAGLAGFWPRALVLVPMSVGAAIAVGWVFYHFVESRFLAPPSWRRLTLDAGRRPATA